MSVVEKDRNVVFMSALLAKQNPGSGEIKGGFIGKNNL
jgi:hypothetical protein